MTAITISGVTPEGLVEARKRLDRLNRRARKGLTGGYEMRAQEVYRTTNRSGIRERLYDITIVGQPPRYEGWTVLGQAEWDRHAGLITRLIPGVERVDRDTLREGWCDHCHTTRMRTRVFILVNDEGRQVQVGSTCLKDFLGWAASSIVPLPPLEDEISAMFDVDVLNARRHAEEFETTEVVALALAITLTHGYQPASWEDSTACKLLAVLDGKISPHEIAKPEALIDAHEKAEEIIAYLSDPAMLTGGDFVINLRNAISAPYCTRRNLGLLASGPHVWMRATGQERERREQVTEAFVGEPGDKITIAGTVVNVRDIDKYFGGRPKTTWVYTVIADGHRFTWFASSPAMGGEPGGTYRITGTIKKHDEWNGRKSTVLTRCKVTPVTTGEGQETPAAS